MSIGINLIVCKEIKCEYLNRPMEEYIGRCKMLEDVCVEPMYHHALCIVPDKCPNKSLHLLTGISVSKNEDECGDCKHSNKETE